MKKNAIALAVLALVSMGAQAQSAVSVGNPLNTVQGVLGPAFNSPNLIIPGTVVVDDLLVPPDNLMTFVDQGKVTVVDLVNGQTIMTGNSLVVGDPGAGGPAAGTISAGTVDATTIQNFTSVTGGTGSKVTSDLMKTGSLTVDGTGITNTGSFSSTTTLLGGTSIISADGTRIEVKQSTTAGVYHGLAVGQDSTSLSGGTNSSSLLLQDAAATLSVGTATSSETQAIRVTGTDADGGGAGTLTTTAVAIGGVGNTNATIVSGASSLAVDSATGTTVTGALTANNGATINNGAVINGVTNINTTSAPGTLTTIGNPANMVAQQSLQINGAMSSTGNATIATGAGTTNNFGSGAGANNTIGGGAGSMNSMGNAGTSLNTVAGLANTLSATTAAGQNVVRSTGTAANANLINATAGGNTISAAQQNTILGGTGNSITASTGNNVITASSGDNLVTGIDNTITGMSSNRVTTVGGGTLTTTTTGLTALASDGSGLSVNNSGAITLRNASNPSGLSIGADGGTVTLLNDVADGGHSLPGHGLSIGPVQTLLTGGTNSSSLLLEDAAATLSVGTATSSETRAIVVRGTDPGAPGGITATEVEIGGANNTSTLIHSTAANTIAGATNTISGSGSSQISGGSVTPSSALFSDSGISMSGNAAMNGDLTVAGHASLATLESSGLATLDSVQVINGLAVAGATSTNGINNTGNISNSGNISTATLNTTGDVSVGGGTTVAGTLGVTGNASLSTLQTSGLATLNSAQVTNSLTVLGATTTNGITNNGTLQNNGNVVVTGSATVNSNFTASTNAYLGGSNASAPLVVTPTSVSYNTNASMNGNKITGLANGSAATDAVSYGQLLDVRKEARRGIANAAALAGLPALEAGKQYNFGVGVGHYKGESSLAFGGHARIDADTTAKFGLGFTGGDATLSAGIGWSF